MGERKVLNKYIPADFDPRLVPRGKKPKDEMVSVRMMLPFSVQCSTCSSFMYRGTKFNSKKEPVQGPNGLYLGIQRYRLYIKCTTCASPITFLTDPKHADYEMEGGGTRNYEVWHDKRQTESDILKEKEEDETLDPMKALENRVLDSQREMQDMENLDEIKAMNRKHLQMQTFAGISSNGIPPTTTNLTPNIIEDLNDYGTTAEEEALLSKIQFGNSSSRQRPSKRSRSNHSHNSNIIKRLPKEEELSMESSRQQQTARLEQQQRHRMEQERNQSNNNHTNNPPTMTMTMPLIRVKRKRLKDTKKLSTTTTVPTVLPKETSDAESSSGGTGLGGLLGAYGSSSDSDQ